MLMVTPWLALPAGGVFYNSNQSAEYIRSFDRNSAIDAADIVYYNMAGTVRLPPGLSFNLSDQMLFQRATVRTLGNPVLGDRRYVSDNPIWLVPNAYLAYRRNRWALFTALETIGATAVRQWNGGLPSLDLAGKVGAGYGGAFSQVIGADAGAAVLAAGGTPAQAEAAARTAGLDATPFPSHSWLKGSSLFLAWRHGAAYRFSPGFALALAGRLVWVRQEVLGQVTGACDYDSFNHDLHTSFQAPIDVTSRAVGYSGEIGINSYPLDGLVLSLTYEMATSLRFRTTVRDGKDGHGHFQNGRRSHLDLPQVWRFGIGYQLSPALRLSAGMNAYLEHAARMDLLDDPVGRIDASRDYRNTYEQSAAVEYRLNDRWLLSLGANFNRIGQRRSATLDTSVPGAHADYLSLGTGFRYQRTDRLKFNVGLAYTGFIHSYGSADVAGDQALQARFAAQQVAINPSKAYDKRYFILALGIDYQLSL